MSFAKHMRILLAASLLAGLPLQAFAAGAELRLDKAPLQFDQASLQHGAKLFVNYCLNCHGASAMRYNRLEQIGLSKEQIEGNLLFTANKVGELMTVAMPRKASAEWFGATPPDLSVIARARASADGSGADWLYTYLRQFYRDASRPTGWNNVVFENVGMPHALWELQGFRPQTTIQIRAARDEAGALKGFERVVSAYDVDGVVTKTVTPLEGLDHHESVRHSFGEAVGGKLPKEEYDEAVADLVSFMTWMGEPDQQLRKQIGLWVLAVLGLLAVLSYLLKREYWKDLH